MIEFRLEKAAVVHPCFLRKLFLLLEVSHKYQILVVKGSLRIYAFTESHRYRLPFL